MIQFQERGAVVSPYPVGRHIKIGHYYPDHGHTEGEIFWIEEGHGFHRVNGVEHPIRAGSVMMIRPQDRHCFGPPLKQLLQIAVVPIPVEVLQNLEERYFKENPVFFWTREPVPFTIDLDAPRLRQLNEWAEELSRSPHASFYLDRFLLNVFNELSSYHEEITPADAPAWLLEACAKAPELIEGGLDAFFNLCGRSRAHVSRAMRRYLDTTPTDFVNKVRMNYARRQLEMGNREILEIALDCGMENLSHFYTLFRQNTGTTPRAYRLRHRRNL